MGVVKIKIKIMSMQRTPNYGSFLQAYGLKKTLEGLGHEVEFVDFHIEPCIAPKEETPAKPKIKNAIKAFLRSIYHIVFFARYKKIDTKTLKAYYMMETEIKSACKNYLKLTDEKNYSSESDVLIIGSDEVFNCLNTDEFVGYALELFGKNCKAGKIMSYAASFGNTTYEKLCSYGVRDEIAELLGKFAHISVRDKNSVNIINKLLNIEPYHHVDPVLLYSFNKEINELKPVKIKNYIIIYAYPCRIKRAEGKLIRKFAKKHNKKIITVSGYQFCADEHISCSSFEALSYFKNADYVVTDTFHGTVMSIKYNKNFAVFVRESEEYGYGNEEKICGLLEKFSLKSRRVGNGMSLENILESNIDYNNVNRILEKEIEDAGEYLKKSL